MPIINHLLERMRLGEMLTKHLPDLKQLLYILTVSDDGGVPVYFQAASGNVTDDQTHQDTWKLMAQLVQRSDFVYDCKLATTDNMNEIARLGGRFITVLPAIRKEDKEFRTKHRPMLPHAPVACSGRCKSSRNFVTACGVRALAFVSERKLSKLPRRYLINVAPASF